ncbi:hypothetical protein AYL99_07731 [Fonsecaea erecta]|uniref:RecF/RecN/SMC N-terminal domain-containing protein n=1 Tax=Fonsecaea erecta TaxID=1367422 RepID=A0A178ZGP3_9EURO|nr:hypothetical protein AYL99_07731 [Fonsecaea erecta]OAP58641.1 hypothetical protein AYL99_07731 [Fonsecaea erecta]
MARLKRPAPDYGVDDGDTNTSGKRRRTTSDESSFPRGTSSDRLDGAEASTPPSDFGSYQEDYDKDDDDDDDDDEEEEEEGEEGDEDEDEDGDDEAVLAAIEARSRDDDHNKPADYGILEGVHLKNFMSHEDMSCEFGPCINFICGKNGSGKSAILTAIVLCLGGKAAATNRGARLQDFIREGTDNATIICRLKNQGENAYMPDVYGKTIQVERHISRSGVSGFKLKSDKGRIVSTRKSDLEEICDHMMLQIENPMAILSQDQARQFIATSSPAEKYKYFLMGVQLEQLDQDYRVIEEQLDNISAKIADRAPDLKVLKGKASSAANKLTLSNRYEAMNDKVRTYREKLAWAQVAEKEALRDEYVATLAEADAKIAAYEARMAAHDAAYDEAAGALAAAQERHEAAKSNVERLEGEQKELKAQHDNLKKNHSEVAADQRQIRGAMANVDRTIKQTKADIKKEEQRLAELDGGGAARRIRELEEAKEALEKAQDELQVHLDGRGLLAADIEAMARLEHEAREAKRNEDQRVVDLDNNLKRLMENRDSQDLAFHPKIHELLRALHAEKGFRDPPVGPLGKHIKLLKPEWSSILEKTFGKSLAAFIVSNKEDEHLLTSIMRQTRCVLPIVIANKLPLNIEPHLPDPQFDTILSVLEIDNEAVKKQLIIAHQIEQTILIPDMTEASKILFSGRPLRNVRRCYCFQPGDKTKGASLFYRKGKSAQDPVHEYIGPPRMRTNSDEAIQQQQQVLADCKKQRLRADQEYRSAQDRLARARQAVVRHGATKRELEIAVQRAEDVVHRLQEATEDDSAEGGTLEALHEALREAEDQKSIHASSFGDSVRALDELSRKLREATESCKELDERLREARAVVVRERTTVQRAEKERATALALKNRDTTAITTARADRAHLERAGQNWDKIIAESTKEARLICERVSLAEGETAEVLKKKHERLKADYDKYQDLVGDRNAIAAEASKCAKAYEAAQKELASLESLQAQFTMTLADRRKRWMEFRGHITARARGSFILKLSERGFRGRLIVDHKRKHVDTTVEPDITRRNGTGRSAKTLSGGEKSFTQICLLLSIWDAMGVPIRCLDEFDVFMDAVNRTTSVQLLIDGARQSSGSQFLLISPGNKSDIQRAPDICIIEIAPPERGQTRLVLPRT